MDQSGTPSKNGAVAMTGVTHCLQHLRVLAALCVGIVLIMSACIPFIQCHNVFRAVLASWQTASRGHATAVTEVRSATQELQNLQMQVAALDAWRVSSNQKLELEHKLQDLRGQYATLEREAQVMRQELFNLQYALAREKRLPLDSPGWKPLAEQAKDITESIGCDKGTHIYDTCHVTGDVRIMRDGKRIVLLSDDPTLKPRKFFIQPHPRKFDDAIMRTDVSKIELSVMPKSEATGLGKCVNMKPTTLPVLVFSVGGMIGNFVNDYSDVFLPLFQTAAKYKGEVVLHVIDKAWWAISNIEMIQAFSNYKVHVAAVEELADDAAKFMDCFYKVHIGLRSHLIFYDMVNSEGHLDESLAGVRLLAFSDAVATGMGLPSPLPSPIETAKKRPTIGILSKSGKRKLLNEKEVAAWARDAGFDVLVLDCDMHCTKTPWKDLVWMMRTMDAYVGVEGEEMMHSLLMRPNSVVVQLMQYGTDYTFLGAHCKHVAVRLELSYVEWVAKVEDTNLLELVKGDKTHPAVVDPSAVWGGKTALGETPDAALHAGLKYYHELDVKIPKDEALKIFANVKQLLAKPNPLKPWW